MHNAYAIGVSATLEDFVTAPLLRIVEGLDKANVALLDFKANLKSMSSSGMGLARSMEKATAASAALGDTASGLTRASYVLDTMAASSADLARNMATARAESNGMGSGRTGGGNGGSGASGSPGGARGGTAAGVAGAGMLWGVVENARLSDTNVKAVATSQVPLDQWSAATDALRKREFDYASQYAFASGGKIEPFAESMLEASRLLRTLPEAKQVQMMDTAMPYIALEAKLKDVSLPESTQAFIGLAHMAGAYDPKEAAPLFESMVQTSLASHASLGQIARAASYALPALHAAGANSSDVMLLVATMMQGGIMNTKSGTWLNAMAGNALPNTLGSGLFSNKKQNLALHDLDLYKGNQSQFYQNGSMDLMKIVGILAEDRIKMDPLKFNAELKMAFGTQGQRAASFFSEDTTIANLHALSALKTFSVPPLDLARKIEQLSTIAKADQTIANANITLMNGTATFMAPVNAALSGATAATAWSASFSKDNPLMGGALDFGVLFGGAMAGMAGWKGTKSAYGMVEKATVDLTKYIGSSVGGIIARSFAMVGIETVGAGALAAAGGTIAIGAVMAGGIAFALAAGLKWAMDKLPTAAPPPNWQPKGPEPAGRHGYDAGHPSFARMPPVVHNHVAVAIDGNDVASHVTDKMVPKNSLGPSGFNSSSSPMRPAMSSAN